MSNCDAVAEHGLCVFTNTSIVKIPNTEVSFDLGCYFMDGKGKEGWAEGIAIRVVTNL